jgi:hypothetical protein
VLVAKGDENAGHGLPRGRDGLGVVILHVDNLSYIDMFSSTGIFVCSSRPQLKSRQQTPVRQ